MDRFKGKMFPLDQPSHMAYVVYTCKISLATILNSLSLAISLKVCVYHDDFRGREVIREHLWRFHDSPALSTSPDTSKFNVLVTTYETLLTDIDHLSTFRWRVMITDEGHRLKSPFLEDIEGFARKIFKSNIIFC